MTEVYKRVCLCCKNLSNCNLECVQFIYAIYQKYLQNNKKEVRRHQVITSMFSFSYVVLGPAYPSLFLHLSVSIYHPLFKHAWFDKLLNFFFSFLLDLFPEACFIFCMWFWNPANSLLGLSPKTLHGIHYQQAAQPESQERATTNKSLDKYFLKNFQFWLESDAQPNIYCHLKRVNCNFCQIAFSWRILITLLLGWATYSN